MDRRLLAEGGLEPGRVGGGDLAGIERPQPLLQLQRPTERRLHRNLLVEGKAHHERERVLRDQRVGVVVAGEVELVRPCGGRHAERLLLRGWWAENRCRTPVFVKVKVASEV